MKNIVLILALSVLLIGCSQPAEQEQVVEEKTGSDSEQVVEQTEGLSAEEQEEMENLTKELEKMMEEDKEMMENMTDVPLPPEPVIEENTGLIDLESVIVLCDSSCNVDADFYCQEEMTIVVGNESVTGTCRAFAKKEQAIEGFSRCEGFCKEYDKSGTEIKTG